MALVVFGLLAFGCLSLAILVQGLRAHRDDAEPVVIRERAPLEKSEGDRAGTPGSDADHETSLTGYTLFI